MSGPAHSSNPGSRIAAFAVACLAHHGLAQQTELTHIDAGGSIARSGEWLFIGASMPQPGTSGEVHTYRQSAGGWDLQQVLDAPPGTSAFGYALEASGDTLAVTSRPPAGYASAGRVDCYELSAQGTWVATQALLPPAANSLLFGFDVELDGDQMAIVGAENSLFHSGDWRVYVYARESGDWQLEQTLAVGADVIEWEFLGAIQDVAIRADTLVVGMPGINGGAIVFRRLAAGWRRMALLRDPQLPTYTDFGQMVATDGSDVLVGAVGKATPSGGQVGGVVTVFTEVAPNRWMPSQRMRPGPPGPGNAYKDRFDTMDFDGDELLLGARLSNAANVDGAGALYYYRKGPDGWPATETARFVASQPTEAGQLGTSVDMQNGVALAGGPGLHSTLVFGPTIGRGFCETAPNSTGHPAQLEVYGSDVAEDRQVLMCVQDAPPHAAGLFLGSLERTRRPFLGSTLCLGKPITRLSPMIQTDAAGRDLRFAQLDRLGASWSAGSTWYLQFWHRDPLGQGSGLSRAASTALR